MLRALSGLELGLVWIRRICLRRDMTFERESGLESTIGLIERTIGLENVPVFHANDSKIALGGRVDRHEHIGKGKIGAEAFRRILTHPRLGATFAGGSAGAGVYCGDAD